MKTFNETNLVKEILRIAKGGPTVVVDVPIIDPDFTIGANIAAFKREHPDAEISEDHYTGESFAVVPVNPRPPWMTIYVAVDCVHRNYGGPEEGGWWYDSGEPVEKEPVRVWLSEDGTPSLRKGEREFLHELAIRLQKNYVFGENERSSMHPKNEDDYDWRVTAEYPEDWPRHRPHYE